MITAEDISALVNEDLAMNEELRKKTNFIATCTVCGRVFQRTVNDVQNGKKQKWCTDQCAQASVSQKKAKAALDHLREVVKHFHETVDQYDLHRDRQLESESVADDTPPESPYLD